MKKYLLPVLICIALVVTMPGVALAKGPHDTGVKDITAQMKVKGIDDTVLYENVFPLDAGGNVLAPPDLSDPNFDLAQYLAAHPDFDLGQFVLNPEGYWADYLLAHVASWSIADRAVYGQVKDKGPGKLKGKWEFTYSGEVDLFQTGEIHGTLLITVGKKSTISCDAVGSTMTVGAGVDPKKGPYIDVVFAVDALSIAGGTGKYQGISGTGTMGGLTEPIRLFLDDYGHVTGVKGTMTLQLSIVFPDDD